MLTNEQLSEIYKWWSVFKRGKKLVEIRAIGNKKAFSGYYKNIENLIRDVDQHQDCNIYYTIGNLDEAVYGRSQCEVMEMGAKTTKDNEVVSRDFVFIDLDCEHGGISGINSTDEEKHLAHLKAIEVYKFLMDNGFNSSIIPVDSCNSYHLFIPCRIQGTPENDEMVKRFTQALSMIFSDEHVKIDESIYSRAQLAKLPGVYSRKGSPRNPDRPQRMCKILKVPDEIIPNDKEYFEKIAALYPVETEKPSFSNNFNTSKFDLDDFLQKHNIEVTKIENIGGGKKYILKQCCFDPSHTGRDACIFVSPTGAIGYHCFHAHCSHFTWQDVRLKYEPDAYSKSAVAEFRHKQRYFGGYGREPFKPKPENEKDGRKWLSGQDVKRVDIDELTRFNTGYFELDKAMWGLFLGDLTIVSGTSGSGKSSWLNCVLLNLVQANVKVAVWSGELVAWKLFAWLDCAAAGKNYTKKKFGYDNWYYAPQPISEKINNWLKRNLIVYNNNYGNNFSQLFSDVKECINNEKREVIVIDNLAALDISDYGSHELERQTNFITDMKNLAQAKNIHVIVVAHPRKLGQEMAVKESVSGNNNLTNLADNVIIVNRRGIDFQKRFAAYLGEQEAQKYKQYDTILHLAKSRMSGIQDKFFGLFFEPESRRIKNSVAEYVVYGWVEEPQQMELPPVEDDGTDIEDANVEYAPQQEPTYKIEKGYTPDTISDFDPFEPLDNNEPLPF